MTHCGRAAVLIVVSACAGSELVAESRGARELIQGARQGGAYRCAPAALALAESHVEFAEQELKAGERRRARDHLRIADWNAREAVRLSGAERCRRSPVGGRQGAPGKDADDDGLLDAVDKCPHEPEDRDGFEDQDGCAEPDNDRDGLADPMDRCPNEAEDRDGFQDGDGCAEVDADQDGTPDPEDGCPGEFGAPADGGCPARPGLVQVTSETIETREPILFESITKAEGARASMAALAWSLSPRSRPLLDEIAAALKARPALRLRIEGHTDTRGSRARNLSLSKNRAEVVKAHLVDRGVEASRLETVGHGPDQPIESNRTAAGRQKNQRIEFVIIKP